MDMLQGFDVVRSYFSLKGLGGKISKTPPLLGSGGERRGEKRRDGCSVSMTQASTVDGHDYKHSAQTYWLE